MLIESLIVVLCIIIIITFIANRNLNVVIHNKDKQSEELKESLKLCEKDLSNFLNGKFNAELPSMLSIYCALKNDIQEKIIYDSTYSIKVETISFIEGNYYYDYENTTLYDGKEMMHVFRDIKGKKYDYFLITKDWYGQWLMFDKNNKSDEYRHAFNIADGLDRRK